MKIFLDANILVAVLNKEYPLYSHAARILSLADHKDFEVYSSPLCLAIAYYFAAKKNKRTARRKITLLSEKISIAPMEEKVVKQTAENSAIHDFEDGLEYYAALESRCKCIITENEEDFYFSSIEVLNCKSFVEKYF